MFLATHPSGFYADLAREQIEAGINTENALGYSSLRRTEPPAPSRETPTGEAMEWDNVKDSGESAALQRFIKRFPDSPLAINAQQRIDLLNKAAQEREEQARAEPVRRRARLPRRPSVRPKRRAGGGKRREDERRAQAEAAEKARPRPRSGGRRARGGRRAPGD